MSSGIRTFIVSSIVILSMVGPFLLAGWFIPLGEGLDEFGHLDNIFFRFTRPEQTFRVREALAVPGSAPAGQPHQAPFYYQLMAKFLHSVLDPQEVSSFPEYQAGLEVSSEGLTMGGRNSCPYRESLKITADGGGEVRSAMKVLRSLSVFMFGATVLLAFFFGRLLKPGDFSFSIMLMLLVGGIPTAIWRSSFVSNDNLLALLSGGAYTFGLFLLMRSSKPRLLEIMLLTLLASITFLTKYNGVSVLPVIIGALLVLRFDLSLKEKFTIFLVSLVLAVFLSGFDLYENYIVDGDLFSVQATIEAYPFLHRPSSFFSVLTSWDYYSILYRRFYCEYFDRGTVIDPRFFKGLFKLWYLVGFLAVLGGVSLIFRIYKLTTANSLSSFVKNNRQQVVYSVYLAVVVAATYLVLANFFSIFPMPCGRYLHGALIPIMAIFLLAFGCLPLPARYLRMLTLFFTVFFYIVGQGYTFYYLYNRYGGCINRQFLNRELSIVAVNLDLDGDHNDEIMLFERKSARSYFVRQSKNGSSETNLVVDPQWALTFGLMGDDILSGNLDSVKPDFIISYRPFTGLWSVIHPQVVTSSKEALKSGLSLDSLASHFKLSLTAQDSPLVGDVDNDGQKDLCIFSPRLNILKCLKNLKFENGKGFAQGKYRVKLGRRGEKGRLLFVRINGRDLIARFLPDEGIFKIQGFNLPEERVIPISKGADIQLLDVNGDGTEELIWWQNGERCFSLISLDLEEDVKAPEEICPFLVQGNELVFTKDLQPFRLRRRAEGDRLCFISKLTGKIYCASGIAMADVVGNLKSEWEVFDPGWWRRGATTLSY